MTRHKWIDPQDFSDLRRFSGLTRTQAADLLNVTRRTIQNWELGGARIPWMAYKLLRILQGTALPGSAWDGWTVRGESIYSPTGRQFDAVWLDNIELVYAQAKMWRHGISKRQMRPELRLLHFPELAEQNEERRQA